MITTVKTDSMMSISEAYKAQSWAVTLSKKTSGRGGYVFLSGSLSWVSAKDAVARIKLQIRMKNAKKVFFFSFGCFPSPAGSGIGIRMADPRPWFKSWNIHKRISS